MIVFETEHLLFRPLLPGDLDSLAKLYADPAVMRFIGGSRNKEEVRRALDSYIREYQLYGHAFFAIITKDGQDFIGHCRLLNQEIEDKAEMELSYVLAKTYWQHGLAVEGIQALKDYGLQQQGYPRLISLIHPDNQPSIHIAEKIGMHYEKDVYQWEQTYRLYAADQPTA